MTTESAQIYRDIFHREAPWTKGSPEERQAAWDRFQMEADAMEIDEVEFDQFLQRIRSSREVLSDALDGNEQAAA